SPVVVFTPRVQAIASKPYKHMVPSKDWHSQDDVYSDAILGVAVVMIQYLLLITCSRNLTNTAVNNFLFTFRFIYALTSHFSLIRCYGYSTYHPLVDIRFLCTFAME